MARDIFVNGETLVQVKGPSGSGIATLSELGLSVDPIRISPEFNRLDVMADAWGKAPFEEQWMLATVRVQMTLVHFDRAVLSTCVGLGMANATANGNTTEGVMARAGARMGNNVARFAAGNCFIGLNLTSPIAAIPWRFFYSFLDTPPYIFPLGTERSLVTLNWRVIPYTQDPYNGGSGAAGYVLWDHTADT